MSSEQTQIPWDYVTAFHPTDLEAKNSVGTPLRLPLSHSSLWLETIQNIHTTDSHTQQPEAFVLPMKIKSINSYSLAGVRDERWGCEGKEWKCGDGGGFLEIYKQKSHSQVFLIKYAKYKPPLPRGCLLLVFTFTKR